MNHYAHMIRNLKSPEGMQRLMHLYGDRDAMLVEQTARYTGLLKHHEELFHETEQEVLLISAPGRIEIGGNHTDHNRGRVIAAAVNQDVLSAVSARQDLQVHLYSDGYEPLVIDLKKLSVVKKEKGSAAALVRGIAARMQELGYAIGGFNAAVTSAVAPGAGMSSSAAFSVLICAIFDQLYNGFRMDPATRARICQFAENTYFGKPCGMLDQMAASVGGMIAVDFKGDEPEVRPLDYDFTARGYAMVVVETGSHANLTKEYAAIPAEMKQVAACFGESYLRRIRPEEFYHALPSLRGKVSDRALLRAVHFFEEDERVMRQVAALDRGDLYAFMWEVLCSGRSSFMYLQNVYARSDDQPLSLALAMAEHYLMDKDGAWRIHGGGFAGTTLNLVPSVHLQGFIDMMETTFGEHCCHVMDIRPEGPAVVRL